MESFKFNLFVGICEFMWNDIGVSYEECVFDLILDGKVISSVFVGLGSWSIRI